MNPAIFELIKDEHLTKPLRAVKRVGQASLMLAFVGIVIVQLNQGKMGGTPLLDFASWIIAWGVIAGVLCLLAVGLVSLGKTSSNSTVHAVGRALRTIFLYMFLPALVLTLILVYFFVIPRP